MWERVRNLHSSHWFYPPTIEMNFPTFDKVMWERERERNLHSSRWFYPPTIGTFTVQITHRLEKWIPHFWQSHELCYFVLHSYFNFLCPPWYWYGTQRKLHLNLFWCFIMLHLIFKIGLRLFPSKKEKKNLQSSIVLVEDFNELQLDVEKMLESPFYILNIEWFYILGF